MSRPCFPKIKIKITFHSMSGASQCFIYYDIVFDRSYCTLWHLTDPQLGDSVVWYCCCDAIQYGINETRNGWHTKSTRKICKLCLCKTSCYMGFFGYELVQVVLPNEQKQRHLLSEQTLTKASLRCLTAILAVNYYFQSSRIQQWD